MRSTKILGLGLIAGIISIAAFAEPAVQPGETLESLSQAKITTTVNGQPGSLKELAASGKIKILGDAAQAMEETPASEVATSDAVADESPASETAAPEASAQ